MSSDAPAKIYSDQRTVVTYLGDSGTGFRMPLREKWRAPDAIAAVMGFIATGAATTAELGSGHALTILAGGSGLTVAAVWLLAKLPATRPSLFTRARWMWARWRPRIAS
ncbi:MAG: hypothetical protein QOE41_1359 [Mycobacterium sp.]|jgi:hypothetical protein|nr:hypothetical protein [Mycobacterium sp.]MDT5132048.1 hypothetical protein [Mycobacterium sp.]